MSSTVPIPTLCGGSRGHTRIGLHAPSRSLDTEKNKCLLEILEMHDTEGAQKVPDGQPARLLEGEDAPGRHPYQGRRLPFSDQGPSESSHGSSQPPFLSSLEGINVSQTVAARRLDAGGLCSPPQTDQANSWGTPTRSLGPNLINTFRI